MKKLSFSLIILICTNAFCFSIPIEWYFDLDSIVSSRPMQITKNDTLLNCYDKWVSISMDSRGVVYNRNECWREYYYTINDSIVTIPYSFRYPSDTFKIVSKKCWSNGCIIQSKRSPGYGYYHGNYLSLETSLFKLSFSSIPIFLIRNTYGNPIESGIETITETELVMRERDLDLIIELPETCPSDNIIVFPTITLKEITKKLKAKEKVRKKKRKKWREQHADDLEFEKQLMKDSRRKK